VHPATAAEKATIIDTRLIDWFVMKFRSSLVC
jgi:hypothetical protein